MFWNDRQKGDVNDKQYNNGDSYITRTCHYQKVIELYEYSQYYYNCRYNVLHFHKTLCYGIYKTFYFHSQKNGFDLIFSIRYSLFAILYSLFGTFNFFNFFNFFYFFYFIHFVHFFFFHNYLCEIFVYHIR